MKIIVRFLGVAAAAVAGHLALVYAAGGPEQGDANIGAGLIVFAVLVGLSFVWALVDGYREGVGLGSLAVRWAVVSVVVPVLITLALWAVNGVAPDWSGLPEMFVLWVYLAGMAFVPAVVGAAIGYAARSGSAGVSRPAQLP